MANGGSTSGDAEAGRLTPGDARLSTMFPDTVELGGRAPGSTPLPAPQDSRADKDDEDDEGSKLYVWNPTAETTEAFPRLPRRGEPGRS
jgi:hypothetical protein